MTWGIPAWAKIPSPSSPWWFSLFALILFPLFSYGVRLTLRETTPDTQRHAPSKTPKSVHDTLENNGNTLVEKMSATHARPDKELKSSQDALHSQHKQLHGLIIGIDNYMCPKIPDLSGAVADSAAVCAFFSNNKHITNYFTPHLKYLKNKDATRETIIRELRALHSDKRIQRGDPILIYYAGHGSSMVSPAKWTRTEDQKENGNIQFIVPYDCDEWVAGIPDRSIAACLDHLAEAKGNNITVIFDCCHSGSGTRGPGSAQNYRERFADLPTTNIPANLDAGILQNISTFNGKKALSRGSKVAPKFFNRGLRSHILLSACGVQESALEEDGRGVFTKALLETLEQVMSERVSYEELMWRMPDLSGQNPQCEGVNLNRRLFSTELAPSSHLARSLGPSFALIVRSPKGQLEIGATPSLPGQPFPARQDDEGVTSFCIELGPGLDEVFERLKGACDADNLTAHVKNSGDPDYGLQLVQADIIVSVLNGRAVFDDLTGIGSASRKASKFKRLPSTSEPDFDSLYPIISAASHWFYHLRRRPTNSLLTRSKEVTIEFMELSETSEYDAMLMPKLGPSTVNLITQDAQSRNMVDIMADEETLYGQKIRNSSRHTLYPYLFYFDSSDFSITPYYLPPISTPGGKPDPALPPNGSLALGYGSGGASPHQFFLREDQDVDIGHLKLYLTTDYVDLSSVLQDTPFTTRTDVQGRHIKKPRARAKKIQSLLWDEITVTIVQRAQE